MTRASASWMPDAAGKRKPSSAAQGRPIRLKKVRRLGVAANEWRQYFHAAHAPEQSGPPILVTGAQRCGTTWFGQMLHVDGTRLYHEPLGKYGVLWHPDENYGLERGIDGERLYERLDKIISGREWSTFNWPHWNPQQRGTTRLSPVRFFGMERGRVIIKDPTACAMLDAIVSRHVMDVVILFRHPCGYASSLKQLNWNPDRRLRTLFHHPAFERYEFDRYRNLYVDGRISEVEKYTLQLGLLNVILLSFVTSNPRCRTYFYEDLASDSVAAFEGVFDDLGLNYSETARARHAALSRSAPSAGLQRHAVMRDSSRYSDIWKQRLTDDEVRHVRRMWSAFDFDLYQSDSAWA